jgi:L-aminopeptidase/D-esterase-like protein
MLRPGPLNRLTDVPGLLVGHATDTVVKTGVTVLLCPDGWTAAVDVRGGGPATRETEVLGLENLVGRVHAISLSGGSVFGLGAADGVTALLSSQGQGLTLTPGSLAIPIVASACLHDLGNEGDKAWGMTPPYRQLGIDAVGAACRAFELGPFGAGLGARAGTRPGGLGSASLDLGSGVVVGALAAVNPVGSVYLPDGRAFMAWPYEIDGEFGGQRPGLSVHDTNSDPFPDYARLVDLNRVRPGAATTLCVVAVSADLTGPECRRVAMMAQDGLARAIRPAHTPFDGDVVFCLAKGEGVVATGAGRPAAIARLGAAAADVLARAIARGVHASAESLAQPDV